MHHEVTNLLQYLFEPKEKADRGSTRKCDSGEG